MSACGPEIPGQLWVPGAGYRAELDISFARSTTGAVAVGTWVRLEAQHRSGPWVPVSAATLAGDIPWLRHPPPPLQRNAQSSVLWLVDPPEQAQFNLPGAADPHDRRVRFHKPGRYTVWGQTVDRAWGDVESSNRLTIVVVDNR